MVEEHAIGIVAKHRIGQGGVQIGAMNLMIVGAKSLEIIGSVGPGLDDFAGLEMPDQVGLGRPGLFRNLRPTPRKLSACIALGVIVTPAPISRSSRACSNTQTRKPKCWSASAALNPPMPPPTMDMRETFKRPTQG